MWKGRNLSLPQDERVLVVRASAPQRLDVYLGQALAWKSRSRLQRLIRRGFVHVNGAPSKPSRKVRDGDSVRLELSMGTGLPQAEIALDILYEDRWIVAVSKPPGLLVHPVGRHVYDTLINHLHRRYRGSSARIPAYRKSAGEIIPRLCHRLDRDTTGVILIAKESMVHREIMAQFERRDVRKEYVALVRGRFPSPITTLATPIGEGRSLRGCLEHPTLKASRTEVRVLAAEGRFTLLACVPLTGRQNQIRVHLAAAGHPIVGDQRFGDDPPAAGFPDRFLLHARALEFYHPRLKTAVALTAELPADFQRLLDRLREAAVPAPGDTWAAPPAPS